MPDHLFILGFESELSPLVSSLNTWFLSYGTNLKAVDALGMLAWWVEEARKVGGGHCEFGANLSSLISYVPCHPGKQVRGACF